MNSSSNRSKRSGRRGRPRIDSQKRAFGLPPAIAIKPINSMSFGYQLQLPASNTQAVLAFSYDDVTYGVGIPIASVTGAVATMNSIFASWRLKSVELWEFSGLPVSLTWSQADNAGVFIPGPDQTVTDSGSNTMPSHCKLVTKPGDIQHNWVSTASTANMVLVGLLNKFGTSGTTPITPRLLIRFHIDYVLNDENVGLGTYTTLTANTVEVGQLYWRNPVTSSNTWYNEGTGIAQYIA